MTETSEKESQKELNELHNRAGNKVSPDNKHRYMQSTNYFTDSATHLKKRSQTSRRPKQSILCDDFLSNSAFRTKITVSSQQSQDSAKRASMTSRREGKGNSRVFKLQESDYYENMTAASQCQKSALSREDVPEGSQRGSNHQLSRRLSSMSLLSDETLESRKDVRRPGNPSERSHQNSSGTTSTDSSEELHKRNLGSSKAGCGEHLPSPCSSSASRVWDCFEEHLRTIHDFSEFFSRQQNPNSFQASSTFQATMVDLYGYPDYSHPHPTKDIINSNVSIRSMSVAGAATKFLRLRKPSNAANVSKHVVDGRTMESARRGWSILKQYVQENNSNKRISQASLSWSMLRHTLKGLTDLEKTRLDLYRRYGIIPSPDDNGNFVMVNTMLSVRARQAIASGSRHPFLAHITKPQSRHQPLDNSLSSSLSAASRWPPMTSRTLSGDRNTRRSRSSQDVPGRSQSMKSASRFVKQCPAASPHTDRVKATQ